MTSSISGGFEIARERVNKAIRMQSTSLSLKGLDITTLPENIGEIRELRELYLHHNQLSNLPSSLGDLKNLRCLHLDDNKFIEIPECISRIIHLEELYLEENNLESIPLSLGRLNRLRVLRVSDNRLKNLPQNLVQCRNLTMLDLAKNQLVDIPESFREMKQLKLLCLHDNTELNIPPEILGPSSWHALISGKVFSPNPQDILNYYFRTRELDKRPINEAKLILVGRGGSGKTSLRKRLTTDDFDEGEDKTLGIQVVPWLFMLGSEQIKLNIWDFGGQEIMHATHQFFLTKRSLYLLVINAREGEQDANIEHWLSLISAYGEQSPVLVVINKCEQYQLDLDIRGLSAKFPCIQKFLWTDCKTRNGIPELKEVIREKTSKLPDLRTPFPRAWFEIKRNLESISEDYLSYEKYQEICFQKQEQDSKNQEILIDFLHDLGNVLYFRDDLRLCNFGVLKPDWVTQGVYGLLNSEELKIAKGILEISQLNTLLDRKRYPRQHQDHLIALMEKFELCFELPNTQHKKFLIPELLPKETPKLIGWDDQDLLRFEYHYNILPDGLLPRFIVRTHLLSENCTRWRNGVELKQGEGTALIRADVQSRCVFITIRAPGHQSRGLLDVIRRQFEEIHNSIKGLTINEKVPIPGYPTVKLNYRSLLVREREGKLTVDFETDTQSITLPLNKLLDNFEDRSLRQTTEIPTHKVIIGDIINILGNSNSILNIKSKLADVSQDIEGISNENITIKDELNQLISGLSEILQQLYTNNKEVF